MLAGLTGSHYSAQLFVDPLTHGWDLASPTVQDTRLGPESVDTDASPQRSLLALVGRQIMNA